VGVSADLDLVDFLQQAKAAARGEQRRPCLHEVAYVGAASRGPAGAAFISALLFTRLIDM
jgi:hypothetical protein